MARHADVVSTTEYLETALAALRSLPEVSVIVFDLDLRCVVAGGQAAAALGLAPADVEGRLIADVLSVERWLFWEPWYRAALRGKTNSVEVSGVDASRWYRVELGPWRVAGAVAGGLAVMRDITERKRSRDRFEVALSPLETDAGTLISSAIRDVSDRERLEGLAAHLAAVVEFSADAIISTTSDGKIMSWNPGAEKLYGYSEAEVRDSPISILVPEGRDDEVATLLSQVSKGDLVDHFETVRRRKDGSLVDVSLTLSAVRGPGGRVVGASTIVRDITAQKRAEQELAQARAEIDRFFGLALDLMIVANAGGHFVRVNPACERVLGYSPEEMIGRPASDFIHPDDLQPTLDHYTAQAAGSPVAGFENRYRCKDGSFRWLLWSAIAMEGGLSYGAARDVTEARLIEEALRTSQAQALDASRLKSEFVANMSHEIRTPLNGVVCMSELLLDTSLSEEQREYATVVLTSAEALMRVINDILDFSKIEAGKLEIIDEDFSIEAAADDVCQILGMKASEKGVELAVSVDPGVPSVVRGDGNRVGQMLINLVGNAIKFTPDGEIAVRIAMARGGDGSEFLRVEVADTGIGIELDRLAELFEPFSQADSTTTRRYGGTGLGLSITKQLAELMGGEIGVQSTPGAGSVFWFTLPCIRGTAVQTGVVVRDLTGTRVLVVDDNASNRQIVERQLASWGMIPDGAGDGRSALELMHRAADAGRPHEAAVIDMRMPEMDGLELARAIKATPRLRGARLILLSGAHVRARDAKAAGIDAVLTKPVRQSMLCNQLVNSLSRAPMPHQRQLRAEPAAAPIPHAGRVLVAEDNEINQIAARRLLQKFGFSVEIAHNGREAIEASRRVEYDAVFMDCQMPEIDGYMATDAIRRREGAGRRTPIIAMTAHTMEGDRDKCLAAGMDDYIAKPLRFANVESVLARLFSVKDPAGNREPRRSGILATAATVAGGEEQPLIDREIVEEILSDGGKAQGLLDLFVRQSHIRLQDLATAVHDGDAAAIARIAHSLKGSCATFGAVKLAKAADRLAANAADRLAANDGPALLTEAARLHAELHDILAATEVALAKAAAAIVS